MIKKWPELLPDAWLEWGGDVALIAGTIVGTCMGGWPGFAIMASSGLFEVYTEYETGKPMGDWPKSW